MTGSKDPEQKQDLIVLFGDSSFLEAVEACLRETDGLGIIRIHSGVAEIEHRLASLRPNLIILDLDDPHGHLIVPFLRALPGVSVLCVDKACTEVLAVCGYQYQTSSTQDFCTIVSRHVHQRVPNPLPAADAWYDRQLDLDQELMDLIQKEANK